MGAVRNSIQTPDYFGRSMNQVLEYSAPAQLEFVSHQQAHADFAWKVTRDTLQKMGYADASRLAGSVTGCARERLEKLIDG